MTSFHYKKKQNSNPTYFLQYYLFSKNQSNNYLIQIKQIIWNKIFNMIFFTKIKTCHLRLNIFKCYFYINITSSDYRLNNSWCRVFIIKKNNSNPTYFLQYYLFLKNQSNKYLIQIKQIMWNKIFIKIFFTKIKLVTSNSIFFNFILN